MSDALNVWRDAQTIYWQSQAFAVITETDDADSENAAALIRTYGDERYQAAIADVVEWLEAQQEGRVSDNYPIYYAHQIARRFGKG